MQNSPFDETKDDTMLVNEAVWNSLIRFCCCDDSDVQRMVRNWTNSSTRGECPEVAAAPATIQVGTGDAGAGGKIGTGNGDDVAGKEVPFGKADAVDDGAAVEGRKEVGMAVEGSKEVATAVVVTGAVDGIAVHKVSPSTMRAPGAHTV